jgi:chaperonin GroEL
MEMSDILYYDDNARRRIISGVNKLAKAVKVTLGPGGKNVILAGEDGMPIVTKDGVSVAKYIKLIDPIENMGAQLIKQVSSNTLKEVGDGTTTATVLANKLVDIPFDEIKNVTEFNKGLEYGKNLVIDYLIENRTKDINFNTLLKVAKTSANGDIKIAEDVASIVNRVGENGLVSVSQDFSQKKTSYEISNGYVFEKGYFNSMFINDKNSSLCSFNSPGYVLIINAKIDNFNDLIPVLQHVKKQEKYLLIIGKEFDEKVIFNCAQNFKMGVNVIPIQAPDFGENMSFILDDIACYCDTKVIHNIKELKENGYLGEISNFYSDKNKTVLGDGLITEKVSEKVNELKNLLKQTKNESDQKKLKSRISQLSSGVANIIVGGFTEAEIKEKFDRYEDAVGATISSIKNGILPGGGIALLNAHFHLKSINLNSNFSQDFINGVKQITESLKEPYNEILNNCDLNIKIPTKKDFNLGVNALTGKKVNMIEEGIIDPFEVTKTVLDNAVSIAIMILSTGAVIDSTKINIKYD